MPGRMLPPYMKILGMLSLAIAMTQPGMWWIPMAVLPTIRITAITMDDFLIRALVAGLGVAAVAGPLGCVLVWRRMAYFGNALSHAALLGVALGLMLAVNLTFSVILVCVAVAGLMIVLEHQRRLAPDTVLGILAHGSLALGLVALAFLEGVRVDLTTFLFGDILAVSLQDLVWIYGGGAVGLLLLALIWRPLLLIIVHRELAAVEGVRVQLIHTIYALLIALVIGVAMKIVGVLLIISMLIIPAAAARRRQQNTAWMWERIDAGLRTAFRQRMREQLPGVLRQVNAGELLPSVAARRLLADAATASPGQGAP